MSTLKLFRKTLRHISQRLENSIFRVTNTVYFVITAAADSQRLSFCSRFIWKQVFNSKTKAYDQFFNSTHWGCINNPLLLGTLWGRQYIIMAKKDNGRLIRWTTHHSLSIYSQSSKSIDKAQILHIAISLVLKYRNRVWIN